MNEVNLNAVALTITEEIPVPLRASKPRIAVERDARTMNNMDPETKAIHIRLEQWGLETRDSLNGYPAVTLLGRLIEQGPMGAGQQGRPPVTLSVAAAHVDVCVGKLCQIDQRALRYYYQAQISREILAKRLSMRVRQAQNVLRRARWRVQAHLAVMEG
jgi:hypothetical protein